MCAIDNNLFKLNFDQEYQVQVLRKERADSPRREMTRLDREFEVDEKEFCSKFSILRKFYFSHNRPLAESLYRQAFAIKKILHQNFWVFLHAQRDQWRAFSMLAKELYRHFHPTENIRHFTFLRLPDYNSSIQKYINQSRVNDHDSKVRKDLISVTADFRTFESGESAVSFLCSNSNMFSSLEEIQNACKEAFSFFIPQLSLSAREDSAKEVTSLFSKLGRQNCGNLVAICIPKNDPDRIYYKSRSFGVPVQDLTAQEQLQLLKQSQGEENLDFLGSDQYRILATRLDPRKHCVYVLSPLPKPKRKELKAQVRQIVENAVLQASSKNTCTHLFWRAVGFVRSLCGSRPAKV